MKYHIHLREIGMEAYTYITDSLRYILWYARESVISREILLNAESFEYQ